MNVNFELLLNFIFRSIRLAGKHVIIISEHSGSKDFFCPIKGPGGKDNMWFFYHQYIIYQSYIYQRSLTNLSSI